MLRMASKGIINRVVGALFELITKSTKFLDNLTTLVYHTDLWMRICPGSGFVSIVVEVSLENGRNQCKCNLNCIS